MPPKKGRSRSVVGSVRDMAHDGSAVVETDEGIVLSVGGQPGERVRVELLARSRGVRRGRLREVLEAGPGRTEPFCPELRLCGGCAWGEMELTLQREIKRRWIAEAVGVEVKDVAVIEGSPRGYRRRARWAWKECRNGAVVGYRRARSRDVVAVSTCPVLVPALQRALAFVQTELAPHLSGSGEIEALAVDGEVGIFLRSQRPQSSSFYRVCEALAQEPFVGVVAQIEDVSPAVFGERSMPLCVRTSDGRFTVQTPLGGFAQGNDELNDALVQCVLAACPRQPTTVVDLFAGSGNLTLPLASLAPQQLWVVESDTTTLDACRANMRFFAQTSLGLSHRHVKFLNLDAQTAIHSLPSNVDVVVLDPPREGTGAELMKGIDKRGIGRVVYVSCNPATLARDLRSLEDYRVIHATMIDMFPQTPHVESVVALEPA